MTAVSELSRRSCSFLLVFRWSKEKWFLSWAWRTGTHILTSLGLASRLFLPYFLRTWCIYF